MHFRRIRTVSRALHRWRVGALLALALGMGAAPVLQAHPHARFSYQLDPVLRDGAVVGLTVRWMLDPLTSLLALRGIDANRNGVADPDELAAFARLNDQLVSAQRYFLSLGGGTETSPGFRETRGLSAEQSAQRIQLSFEVALEQPHRGPLTVRLFDASWYVALSADDPPLPAGHACQGSAALETLETQGWGAQPVPVVHLSCPGT